MNRKTLLLFVTAAVVALACVPVFAHGSSEEPQSGSDNGSMVNAMAAPRARIWYDNRLWQTTEGVILVCEENFIAPSYNSERECYAKGDKTNGSRWSVLQTKQSDGFVLKSYEYRFVGSSGMKQLIAYYGPATVEVPAKTDVKVYSDLRIGIIQTDAITIESKVVNVARKRK